MNNHQNSVELIGYYGNDQIHACSAWTSTSRDLTEDKVQRIPKLLKMLADAGHHTPFEKSSLHFLINTDIASHIHLIKHRVGTSVNGESARYKEIKEDKYLIPNDWPEDWQLALANYTEEGNRLYHQCICSVLHTFLLYHTFSKSQRKILKFVKISILNHFFH